MASGAGGARVVPTKALESRGEARRRRLLQAAVDIYLEHGRDALTQRSVAKRAESSLSAMTYYFDDIRGLIEAAELRALRERIRRFVRVAQRPQDLDGGATEGIVQLLIEPDGPNRARLSVENLAAMGSSAATQSELEHYFVHQNAAIEAILARFGLTKQSPRQIAALVRGAILLTPAGRDPRERAVAMLDDYLAGTAGAER